MLMSLPNLISIFPPLPLPRVEAGEQEHRHGGFSHLFHLSFFALLRGFKASSPNSTSKWDTTFNAAAPLSTRQPEAQRRQSQTAASTAKQNKGPKVPLCLSRIGYFLVWVLGAAIFVLLLNMSGFRRARFFLQPSSTFLRAPELRIKARGLARNGTIAMLVCNNEYLDFLTNWAAFAEDVGWSKHFLVFSEDSETQRYVEAHWPGQSTRVHVPHLETAGKEEMQQAGLQNLSLSNSTTGAVRGLEAPEFRLIMYRRLFYLRLLLAAGLNVLLCDTDVILLRDPLPFFSGSFDLYGVVDIQDKVHWNDLETVRLERGSSMYLNAGFLFFRPMPRSFMLLDAWLLKTLRADRVTGLENDQTYLRFVLLSLSLFVHTFPGIAAVPQQDFPPGWLYFLHPAWREKRAKQIVMIHNNWIRGKQCKLLRYIQHGLWRVPGPSNTMPNVTILRSDARGIDEKTHMIVGIRGLDWMVDGWPEEQLPLNASLCRPGVGLLRGDEIRRWQ